MQCCLVAAIRGVLLTQSAGAQSIAVPWTGYAHPPQHGANAPAAAQPLTHTHWLITNDFTYGAFAHYGSPLITRSNTVIVPVKTGTNSFVVRGVTRHAMAS